jgi:hypothetical protein
MHMITFFILVLQSVYIYTCAKMHYLDIETSLCPIKQRRRSQVGRRSHMTLSNHVMRISFYEIRVEILSSNNNTIVPFLLQILSFAPIVPDLVS